MSKRFTDTDKWKKPFIRTLDAHYKLLWFYILDDCNHAGIWEVDMEVASIRIGHEVTADLALEKFGDRVKKISSTKWFLPDFIFFQYGELNEKNRLHLSVINILNKYNLMGLLSPLEGAKYKDKDKEQDKDKDFGKSENLFDPSGLVPEMIAEFKNFNPNYPFDQKLDFPVILALATKIKNYYKIEGEPTGAASEKIKMRWGEIILHIRADPHFLKYSLTQINKHFQSIIQSLVNATHQRPSTNGHKPGTSEARIEALKNW